MPDIDYIISKKITEYDMKEAGWNLIQYYELLDTKRLSQLKSLSKRDRHIGIGIMCRDDRKFNKKLTKSFAMMRKKFFIENDISDDNILSIKKDAIYVIGKKCKYKKFKNIEFVEKNKYTSFHKFGRIEMYFDYTTNKLDVKGINDEKLVEHEKYILDVLKLIFRTIESQNHKLLVKIIKEFTMQYRERRLEPEYYRELNSDSIYTLDKEHNVSNCYLFGFENIDENMKNNINISYNYMTYILPIIQRFYYIK